MKTIRFILILFIAYQYSIYSQIITDLIKPLHLQAGKTDSVLISDIYYSENYNVSFLPNKNINVRYNEDKEILTLSPSEKFEGLGLIDFKVNDSVYTIPFYSEIVQNHTFELKLKYHPEKVNLFASFNGWNRENLPMNYDKKSDAYSVSVPLEPGSYQYKFYVKGNEFLDPENQDSIPNGLGGYNSVINIPDRHPEKCYLFLDGYNATDTQIGISFRYSNNKYRSPVKRDEIIALLNNQSVSSKQVTTVGNTFIVTFEKDKLNGENVIRTAVNRNGLPSNIQTIRLYNSKPQGDNKPQN